MTVAESSKDTSSMSPLEKHLFRLWKSAKLMDLAHMGGPALQDLGFPHPENVYKDALNLGKRIHTEMSTEEGELKPQYLEVGLKLSRMTPAAATPVNCFTLMCRIATTIAFTMDLLNGQVGPKSR